MRTAAQATASQMALRTRSKEVREEVSVHVILVKGTHAVKHTFWQRVAASHKEVAAGHEEQMSPLMILVLF